jgi:hypothetical protein
MSASFVHCCLAAEAARSCLVASQAADLRRLRSLAQALATRAASAQTAVARCLQAWRDLGRGNGGLARALDSLDA